VTIDPLLKGVRASAKLTPCKMERISPMSVEGKRINFRFVRPVDARFILDLRIDERKGAFLSKVDDHIERQIEWIGEYMTREAKAEEFYFVIEDKYQEKFGCLRLYDFKEESFCWGSWILKQSSPSYMAIESALLVYEFAFYTLGFSRCHFDVRKGNEKVIAFHKRFGATVCGEDELNFYFRYNKGKYEEIKGRYHKYLPVEAEK
jgi:RimJ/RimL family protein N-acetyltransferase